MGRRPGTYRSSFAIEELEVLTHAGETVRLILKDLAAPAAAADAKPAALLDPAREAEVYLEILAPWGLDAPACRGAAVDPVDGRYWLLLEVVDGIPLWQTSDFTAWEAAARWLGDMHSREAPGAAVHLLHYDAVYLQDRLARAVALTPPGALDLVAASWPQVVERLGGWPSALLHGDFYASNLLVEATVRGARVRPVDWDMAGVGPGLLDLAALISGQWTAAERLKLALAYDASWSPTDGRPHAADLLAALEHARLVVAVQWLGWSDGWTPPPERAQSWLAAALDAAARIGL